MNNLVQICSHEQFDPIWLQLQYSPRRALGFGLSDGQQVKRLWSFLRRFSRVTKEMHPSNRVDILSDAILHYGRNCKDRLGNKLLDSCPTRSPKDLYMK